MHAHEPEHPPSPAPAEPPRRGVLGVTSRMLMVAGLAGGYGLLAWLSARFMLPARIGQVHRLLVAPVGELQPGAAVLYQTPDGRTVNITRHGNRGAAEDFTALSSTCPHLGCQVSWEPQNNRYFCPCHNGTFDVTGKATGGPPGDAGQSLPRYGLTVERGLLYIDVPAEQLSLPARAGLVRIDGPRGAGHDPCLMCLNPAATPGRAGEPV